MKLEDIGFYTLSDHRCQQLSATSPLWRCELILTDTCNFKCPYCRGIRSEYSGKLPLEEAQRTIDLWLSEGLKNVRFSGGEPLTYKGLPDLVCQCKAGGVERIAISTNGSAPLERYLELVDFGVNDFSISLDACCSSTGDKMAGGIRGAWDKVIKNIAELSKRTYVTVGVVETADNLSEMLETVKLAHSLGVADIRIISSAQGNESLNEALTIPEDILAAHPILRYRVNNIANRVPQRGIGPSDSHKCYLVLDDIAAVAGYHFPCIIYLREQGKPIGKVGPGMRQERRAWFEAHDSAKDPICSKNCLDVCVAHNNQCHATRQERIITLVDRYGIRLLVFR